MAKNKYKLLMLDIDGTLVGRRQLVSAENRKALDEARQTGVQVSISTGRSLKSSLQIMNQLSLDSYHIFFDGALVSRADLSEEVYVQPIAKDTVRQMIEFTGEHDIDLELFTATRYFAGRETWSTLAHEQFFGVKATIGDLTDLWKNERIVKGGLVSATPEEEAPVDRFSRHFSGVLHISQARTPAFPGVVFNNALAVGVSKGSALEALAAHLGIAMAEVVAVGDGSNDVSLLKTAGLGIAMGNAPDEVKAVADYITLDVDHHGLAEAINKFLL